MTPSPHRRFLTAALMLASLIAFAVQLWCALLLTSNMANILAWGALGTTAPLLNQPVLLFTYEVFHTTQAAEALAIGLWLAALTGLVPLLKAPRHPEKIQARFYKRLLGLSITTLIVFATANAILLGGFPPEWINTGWITMLFVPLDPFIYQDMPTFWSTAIPAALTIPLALALHKTLGRRLSLTAALLASPLLVAPIVIRTYLAGHYLCYGDPEVFADILDASLPGLALLPVLVMWGLDRRAALKASRSPSRCSPDSPTDQMPPAAPPDQRSDR